MYSRTNSQSDSDIGRILVLSPFACLTNRRPASRSTSDTASLRTSPSLAPQHHRMRRVRPTQGGSSESATLMMYAISLSVTILGVKPGILGMRSSGGVHGS